MQNKWVKICQILAEKLQDGRYSVWISPLRAALEGRTLFIAAMNDFVADFVRAHFSELIKSVANEVFCCELEVNILPVTRIKQDLQVQLYQAPVFSFGSTGSEKAETLKVDADTVVITDVCTLPATTIQATPVLQQIVSEPSKLPASFAVQAALPVRWSESASRPKNWRYSFDDFIVGPCNELAHAAARGLCRYEGYGSSSSGVLYLCSPPGLGKTHLMQAVGRGLYESSNFSAPRVEYLTAEEFTTRLRMSIKSGDVDSFKARYRDADVLLLEDVHFMQDKDKLQGELLATIIALLDRGSRVVFSSSFSPRELKSMDSQLVSRLCSGFIAGIDRPDRATRKRIIEQKASMHQVLLPEDIADFLASHIHDDVRQIESCLQNLILKAKLMNCCINMQMVRDTIGNYVSAETNLDFDSIIGQICKGFGLVPEDLNSKSRKKELVLARNTVFYLARKHTGLSLQEIGSRFNRNHSTVIKGITSLEREISRQTPTGRQLDNVISIVERNTASLPF